MISILTTGGTILSTSDPAEGAMVRDAAASLARLTREIATDRALEFTAVAERLSAQTRLADVVDLARAISAARARPEIEGVVVLHGTDTMADVAFALDLVLAPGKPVVLTGAMRPADADDGDGIRNLRDAIAVAASASAAGQGVLLVFAGDIFSAADVAKVDSVAPAAFAALRRAVPGQVKGGVIIFHATACSASAGRYDRFAEADVELVTATLDASPRGMMAAIGAGADAIVIEAFGRGNLPAVFVPVIRDAVSRDVPVVIVSRCARGGVGSDYGGAGGGVDLLRAGAVFGGDFSGPQARLLLVAALSSRRGESRISAAREALKGCGQALL